MIKDMMSGPYCVVAVDEVAVVDAMVVVAMDFSLTYPRYSLPVAADVASTCWCHCMPGKRAQNDIEILQDV
jgi:hypothetical protein